MFACTLELLEEGHLPPEAFAPPLTPTVQTALKPASQACNSAELPAQLVFIHFSTRQAHQCKV